MNWIGLCSSFAVKWLMSSWNFWWDKSGAMLSALVSGEAMSRRPGGQAVKAPIIAMRAITILDLRVGVDVVRELNREGVVVVQGGT
jgi:hypothetical protein